MGVSDLADAVWNQRKPRSAGEMAYHVLEVLTGILEGGEIGKFEDISSTCEKPAPLETKKTGIKNIFNMENMKEMLHFYHDILGTKEQFTMFYWDLLVFFGTDAAENRSAQEVEETRKIFETMRDIHLAYLPEIIRWVVH